MNDDETTQVRYQWEGHLLEAQEREEKTIELGGTQTLICAEFTDEEDGSLTVRLVSNGPQSRHSLTRLVNLLQAVVTQDAIEAGKEERDG